MSSRTSHEPWRASAYSEDLRWRMVWQREALEFSYLVIASNLGVDEATVRRTVDLFRTTGQVAKKPYPSDRVDRVLSTPGQLNLAVQRPGIYLREIQKELVDFLMLHVRVKGH